MRGSSDLYELDAAALPTLLSDRGPVLITALQGFVDAGSASALAAQHLLAELGGTPIAHFDVDRLIDYRARRPRMSFQTDHYESVDLPELNVQRLTDVQGTPFLLMYGPEPDVQWQRFANAMVTLVKELGVRLVVDLHAIPWTSPHTRPLGITPHATDPSLIAGRRRWVGDVDVPGSAAALVELTLGRAGLPMVGFTCHVPHYLATTEYPPAAVALLDAAVEVSKLKLPMEALRKAAVDVTADINRQVAESEETRLAVTKLEREYDQGHSTPDGLAPATPLRPEDLPDSEEIAADFERYLREMDGDSGR